MKWLKSIRRELLSRRSNMRRDNYLSLFLHTVYNWLDNFVWLDCVAMCFCVCVRARSYLRLEHNSIFKRRSSRNPYLWNQNVPFTIEALIYLNNDFPQWKERYEERVKPRYLKSFKFPCTSDMKIQMRKMEFQMLKNSIRHAYIFNLPIFNLILTFLYTLFLFFLQMFPFLIYDIGRPFALQNCSVSNQSSDSLQVDCVENFDGGLPQGFLLELVEMPALRLARNLSLQVSAVNISISTLFRCWVGLK